MKKYISVGLISLSLLILPSVSSAQTAAGTLPGDYPPAAVSQNNCPNLSANLGVGSRDAADNNYAVSALQNFLALNGYYNEDPTGYFGIVTSAAVGSFQAANGIASTGYVGVLTRAAIQSKGCNGNATANPITSPISPVSSAASSTAPACPAGYTCTPPGSQNSKTPQITSISPEQITVGGASAVTLYGSNFNSTLVVDITGPGADTLAIPTSVSSDGSMLTFNFPSSIAAAGSYSISVYNYGKPDYSYTKLNLISSNTVSTTAPSCPSGWVCTAPVPTPVTAPGVSICPVGFTCTAPATSNSITPTISWISPTIAALGSSITIQGSGFSSPSTAVIFNGQGISQDSSPNYISSSGNSMSIIIPNDIPVGVYQVSAVNLGNNTRNTSPSSLSLTVTGAISAPACPAGYNCTSVPGIPANGSCPSGWTCSTATSTPSTPPMTATSTYSCPSGWACTVPVTILATPPPAFTCPAGFTCSTN